MVAFSEGLLSELDPYGVKVSVVCPTFFQSNLAKSMRSDNPDTAKIAAKLHAGTGITKYTVKDKCAANFMAKFQGSPPFGRY